MTFRLRLVLVACLAISAGAAAQQAGQFYGSEAEIRQAIARAQAEGQAARNRAESLEAQAAKVTETVERTAREAAGIAARIQQAEARIAVHEAQARLIAHRQAELRARLAEKQQPLVRLTAALQLMSRRPPVLSLLRPGSLDDAIHMRAVLGTVLPEVERRTAAVRRDLDQAKKLQLAAVQAARDLRQGQVELGQKRQSLLAIEARQRLASREASGIAARESERALALAEEARDLDSLSAEMVRAGQLRRALAALPGPVQRPENPRDAVVFATNTQAVASASGLPEYVMPIAGRLAAGFGDAKTGQPRSQGVVLSVRSGAQAIAPAPGRVVFAGPYRGYGQIVIIEHEGGWTSLVTGLAQLDTRVGAVLVTGSPIGIAGAGHPVITLELRRNGVPVNPLDHVRGF